MDRGIIFAIAHVRGGDEKGKQWHENGKLLNKRNTFTDFIACADYLIKSNYCSEDNLCIEGGSAGGMLIGAVLNMRPELFKVAVADVPSVDVLTTILLNPRKRDLEVFCSLLSILNFLLIFTLYVDCNICGYFEDFFQVIDA